MERNRLYEGRGSMNGEYNTIRKEKNMKVKYIHTVKHTNTHEHTHKLNQFCSVEILIFPLTNHNTYNT